MRGFVDTIAKSPTFRCGCVITVWAVWGASGPALFAQGEQRLIATDAEIVKIAGGYEFTEGPAVDTEGNIYFSDIPNNKIYMWSVANTEVFLFREDTGGANGLIFDKSGNLIACEGTNRQITSTSPDLEVSVVVDRYMGKRFNSPNDLWIDPGGGIYFTDPAYSMEETEIEQSCDGVYYISPDRKDVIRVVDDMNRPNGIVGTADGKWLYVTEHRGGKTWVYQIQPDGKLKGKKLLAALGSDGMTLDVHGNVYLTNLANESVDIYSPEGKLLESIRIPERPANLCFGGPDNKTLFITATTSLYSVNMLVQGQ